MLECNFVFDSAKIERFLVPDADAIQADTLILGSLARTSSVGEADIVEPFDYMKPS